MKGIGSFLYRSGKNILPLLKISYQRVEGKNKGKFFFSRKDRKIRAGKGPVMAYKGNATIKRPLSLYKFKERCRQVQRAAAIVQT